MDDGAKTDETRVMGCVSQVWIDHRNQTRADGQPVIHFRGDSDSHLVRGLIAIALALYSDRTPAEILAEDPQAAFRELGLEAHLTPQRSNGFRSMIERIRREAREAA